jgi:hypothetical protein
MLGSLGALIQFLFLAAYFVYPPPYPELYRLATIDLVLLSWDLGVCLSGFSGVIISFSKQRVGGVVLLVAGIAGLLPWIVFTFLNSGVVIFTLYDVANLSWVALLLIAGLLGITNNSHGKTLSSR